MVIHQGGLLEKASKKETPRALAPTITLIWRQSADQLKAEDGDGWKPGMPRQELTSWGEKEGLKPPAGIRQEVYSRHHKTFDILKAFNTSRRLKHAL